MAESTVNNNATGVIKYKSWGVPSKGFENLTKLDKEIPESIGEHELVLKVIASGLNPVDYKMCEWDSAPFFERFPRDIGVDVAGIVIRAGSSVDTTVKFSLGSTHVYAHTQLRQTHGPVAEYAIVDSRYVSIVPSDLLAAHEARKTEFLTDLAAIPCAGFTAYQAVCVKLRLPIHVDPNNIVNTQIRNIVVTAGAGGVGNFVLQLLREWRENNFTPEERESIRIISTSSAKNFDFVKSLGATHTVDYNTDDLPGKIKEILPKGESIDAWIDLVGAASAEDALKTMSYRGELVVVVENANYANRLFGMMFSVHNVSLGMAYILGEDSHRRDIERYGRVFLDLYRNGKLSIKKTIISFDQVKEGLTSIKAGHNAGKIVVLI